MINYASRAAHQGFASAQLGRPIDHLFVKGGIKFPPNIVKNLNKRF